MAENSQELDVNVSIFLVFVGAELKIGSKIVGTHPFGSWTTYAAQLLDVFGDLKIQ